MRQLTVKEACHGKDNRHKPVLRALIMKGIKSSMKYNNHYPNLLKPIKIGNLTLKNRIFSAPTSLNWGAVDGNLTPETIAYYELKAKGGAAVVTMGESIVHTATGKSHDRQIELDNPTSLVGLSLLARAIKRHGAVPSAELSHGGKWGGLVSMAGSMKEGRVAYGASDEMLAEGPVKEMPEALLLEVIESFGKGAAVLKRAGFEMCMVHAGHGWFFGQFLSKRTNHRTDRFGGSFENRARPLTMALESIRRHVGPGFPIEVRMSADEFVEGGIDLQEGILLAKHIEKQCDLINVSAGMHEDLELYLRTHPTQFMEKGANVYLAEAIRKEVSVPISTVGGIVDPAMMEEIIASGKADLVELGRPLLADPYLPQKLRDGREQEITKCLRCMGCFGESLKTETTSCVINPVIGNEFNESIANCQPTERKKVLVAGGGPGGMKAALTAAERGHEVVLCEKTDALGGALRFAKHVPFKYGLYEYKEVLEYLLKKNGVEIRMNTEVTSELVEQEKPDALLLAVGANPITPKLPGIEGNHVRFAQDIYGKEDQLGDTVAILGGGLVGCETAAHLARLGKNVTIIELRDDLAMDADLFYQTAVKGDLRRNNAKIFVGSAGRKVTKEGILISTAEGSEVLVQADTVINAAGYRADDTAFQNLSDAAPVVQRIGDCRRPGKVTNAVTDGYYMALDL
ncbi:FAD-dependent oxidoreductase [Anoxybacterium hadale]|uniref:FAD-dependent oxidoreductase n=1 Tax=Anoxybacterium hadale TaxID=3408580 RepID=A0ACD1ACH5_9FIRM|nr:FAD-dependent oxidoreductase [Clostridiales bacterium]